MWARDIMVTGDGRIFGMTQYSTIGPKKDSLGRADHHDTQDPDTFGNVWEWDAEANGGQGSWVKLPFNSAGSAYNSGLQVRQPRSMCYDERTQVLYVAAVSCIANYVTPTRWENFGGGLYSYTCDKGAAVGSGTAGEVGWARGLLGENRNLTGVDIDVAGRMWLCTEDGDVYCRAGEASCTHVCTGLPLLCQDFTMASDGIVYLTNRGAGAFRIEPHPPADAQPETGSSEAALPEGTSHEANLPVTPPSSTSSQDKGEGDSPVSAGEVFTVRLGSASVEVSVSSSGTVTLKNARNAKGAVSINSVKLPNGSTCKVTKVASNAFKGSKATKVTLGASVRTVGASAFANCKQLKSVSVGKNVRTLGSSTFKNCKKLKSVTFGKNVSSVGKGAFKGCKKLKVLKVRSAKLTKKSCKHMLKGSSVRTVKLVGMSKAKKAKAAATYAKWLPRGVAVR